MVVPLIREANEGIMSGSWAFREQGGVDGVIAYVEVRMRSEAHLEAGGTPVKPVLGSGLPSITLKVANTLLSRRSSFILHDRLSLRHHSVRQELRE